MRKVTYQKHLFLAKRARINHAKAVRRRRLNQLRLVGWLKYMRDAQLKALSKNQDYFYTAFEKERLRRSLPTKPGLNPTLKYIASKKEAFSNDERQRENGYFEIPEIFSLTEDYATSFAFLKRLYFALYYQSATHILLDYQNCKRIDVDASVCMDILLGEFILYFNKCRKRGFPVKILEITPINYQEPHIKKILFSIGAFSSIRGFRINYEDVIPYPLCIGVIKHPLASKIREIHITQMVEYVLKCMAKMKCTLTAEAEDNLFKVIGEVLINAEEHSSGDKRFSIGYFEDKEENGEHMGTFNLVILNFGKTIYEMFSDPNCPNKQVVAEMKDLSEKYTKNGLFTRAKFEEQTLWTLYALQEGVTSKADWKRGNGSIRFIDSFFNLKGDNEKDNISYLSIVSGNTRITFDGTYRLIDKIKGKNDKKFKMMTFNETGDIENTPDKKYVTFADNYFPGTIISAKICIKEINTELAGDNSQLVENEQD